MIHDDPRHDIVVQGGLTEGSMVPSVLSAAVLYLEPHALKYVFKMDGSMAGTRNATDADANAADTPWLARVIKLNQMMQTPGLDLSKQFLTF